MIHLHADSLRSPPDEHTPQLPSYAGPVTPPLSGLGGGLEVLAVLAALERLVLRAVNERHQPV